MKFKLWDGSDLTGLWTVTLKIDGVRAINTPEGIVSRKGKPLYNIPQFEGDQAEIFCGSFKETIEITRSSTSVKRVVEQSEIFHLLPLTDSRLIIARTENPTAVFIKEQFELAVKAGHEGLILFNQDRTKYLKVKPNETFDVTVTKVIEGSGKYVGKMGALMTDMGKVGTGFTDKERQDLFSEDTVGQTIEVECMQLTEDGKFRHPRFVRIREDK